MTRLVELSEAIREAVPAGAVDALAVVTAFGGATGLMVALSLLYWLGDRRRAAAVVSYLFAALALVVALKAAIGMGRPPEAVQRIAVEANPYGFPSGHAVAAVVAYGGLVTVYGRHRDSRVVAGVAAAVALVGFSRVALGVHYLGDVLVGVALGVLVLALCRRIARTDPGRGFAVAVALAVPAVLVTGASPDATLALGGSVGGAVGSRLVDGLDPLRSRLEGIVSSAVGVPFALGVYEASDGLAPAFSALASALLVFGILALPWLVRRTPVGRASGSPS